jgi:hypothetical protein
MAAKLTVRVHIHGGNGHGGRKGLGSAHGPARGAGPVVLQPPHGARQGTGQHKVEASVTWRRKTAQCPNVCKSQELNLA